MPLPVALDTVAASLDHVQLLEWTKHYSGYVRETAIARCVELGKAESLAALVGRLNDWVPEVRRAAADGLLTLLATVPAEHFVPLLPQLRALTEAKRTDHAAWLSRFEQQLVRTGGRDGIVEALSSPDFRLRRAAYFVSHAQQLLEPSALFELGLRSGDIVLARHAAGLIGALPTSAQPALLRIALSSSFGPVRLAALHLAIRHPDVPEVDSFLHKALFDAQGTLRHAAARALTAKGIDIARLCREALASERLDSRRVRTTLSLMVEIGAPYTEDLLSRYANDPWVDVRVRAMTLQARQNPAARDALSQRALRDASPKVRTLGALLCMRFGAYVSLDQVRDVLTNHGDYRTALRICSREKWDHLVCLGWTTEFSRLHDQLLVELRQALGVWLAREGASWTRPSAQHVELLLRPQTAAALLELAADKRGALADCLQRAGVWQHSQS
jgi:HEAT repeat protein